MSLFVFITMSIGHFSQSLSQNASQLQSPFGVQLSTTTLILQTAMRFGN